MDNDILLADLSEGSVKNEPSEKEKRLKRKRRNAARSKWLLIASIVLGSLTVAVTAVRLLLLPLVAVIGVIILFAVYAYMMLGGGFLLAMMALIPPALILLIIAALLVVIAVLLAELIPILLGALAFVLAIVGNRLRKKATKAVRKKKALKAVSLIFGAVGFIVPVLAAPVLLIPTLILLSPVIIVIIFAVLFLIQILCIAIG